MDTMQNVLKDGENLLAWLDEREREREMRRRNYVSVVVDRGVHSDGSRWEKTQMVRRGRGTGWE